MAVTIELESDRGTVIAPLRKQFVQAWKYKDPTIDLMRVPPLRPAAARIAFLWIGPVSVAAAANLRADTSPHSRAAFN